MHCAFTEHENASKDGNYPNGEFSPYDSKRYRHNVSPAHTNDGMLIVEVPDMVSRELEAPTDD